MPKNFTFRHSKSETDRRAAIGTDNPWPHNWSNTPPKLRKYSQARGERMMNPPDSDAWDWKKDRPKKVGGMLRLGGSQQLPGAEIREAPSRINTKPYSKPIEPEYRKKAMPTGIYRYRKTIGK